MASYEFFFSLEFSSQGAPAALVEELTTQVFRFVGAAVTPVAGLMQALQEATAHAAGGQRRCDVQFRAHNGKLDVLVTANGGRVWQNTLTIS